MKHFKSFDALAVELTGAMRTTYPEALVNTLDDIGKAVTERAKDKVGHYQSGIGQFPQWAPLAASTIDRKQRAGFSNPDGPLLASGAFKDSIGYVVDAGNLKVTIGTDKPYIVNTEMGTAKIPPRPVFGPSALEIIPKKLPKIGSYAACGLAGLRVRTVHSDAKVM